MKTTNRGIMNTDIGRTQSSDSCRLADELDPALLPLGDNNRKDETLSQACPALGPSKSVDTPKDLASKVAPYANKVPVACPFPGLEELAIRRS